MSLTFLSLFFIMVVAVLAPIAAWRVPHRILPEVVVLIIGGILIGPYGLGLATSTTSIDFLHEMGLAFLFLMAGYEIDVNELRGSGGRHAMIAWLGTLVLALAAVLVIGVDGGLFSRRGFAIAIAMTSTAIGTLLPILRERGLLSTAVGAAILNHGAVGEVGPVVLMALLLGERNWLLSLVILALFVGITLGLVRSMDRIKERVGDSLARLHISPATTVMTTLRLTLVLLVGLCALATQFQLDVVLGAFAAGFVLRHSLPEGNEELEGKLDGLAYGFFIPIFFVTSGMSIRVSLSWETLRMIGAFLVLLVLVRGVPVLVGSLMERRRDGVRVYSLRQALEIAVYSTTALPIIVAVTSIAVTSEVMTQTFASNLVLAGVVSVVIMPALGLLLSRQRDEAPAVEGLGLVQGPAGADGADFEAAEGGARPRHRVGWGGRRLSRAESEALAQRLSRLEEERRHWTAPRWRQEAQRSHEAAEHGKPRE